MKRVLLLFLIISTIIGNCQSLNDVISGKILNSHNETNDARLKFIESVAMSYGIYYGRNEYIKEFNLALDGMEDTLNEFNFSALLIDENMLPPVVVEADDFYEREDSIHYRQVHKMYRIIKKASISYNVPSWRNYIYINQDEDKPTLPNDFKLKGKEENAKWKMFATKGVEEGRLQAKEEIGFQFSLMMRDYKGMVLAHYLNKTGVMSFSHLEKFDNGIIIEDSKINIGDTLVSSTDNDKFQSINKWKPFIAESDSITDLKNVLKIEASE